MPQKTYADLIGASHWACLKASAEDIQDLENRYTEKAKRVWAKIAREERPDLEVIDDLLIRNMFEALITATKYAETERELIGKPTKRFAKPKPVKMPRSLKDLMAMYDRYRKKGEAGKLTTRAQALAESVKKQYLKRLEQIYKRYGARWTGTAYEYGDLQAKEKAQKAIQKATAASAARTRTIVATETTNYVTKARTDMYDKMPEVEAYLFLAIRDHRTTQWCKSRHNKWFRKDEAIAQRMTPPIHFNCRSEIVPLTPFNPVHKKILADSSRDASKSRLEPLPKGWGAR